VIEVAVRGWAAWAPGLESRTCWETWGLSPSPLRGGEGRPDVPFLAPLLRRRCSRLTRMMLHAAHESCHADTLSSVPVVCASRYGEITATAALLDALAAGQPLTAAGFTHSVHNTQAGLFSIAVKNRRMSSAVAAGADTFPCAFFEALTLLHRARGGAVLILVGDEQLPPILAGFADADDAPYAVALVLEAAADGPRLRVRPAEPRPAPTRRPWPQAAEFLRWHMSGEKSLTLGAGPRAWTWTREE
jgi:hypothetical protein